MPRTTNGPAPPLASGPAPRSAETFEAPRVSGGRRLTALIAPGIGTTLQRLEPGGAFPLGPRPEPRSSGSLREAVEVPVDDLVAREEADEAAQREPRTERDPF